MTWAPISTIVPQYVNPATNEPYSGAVLKAYAEGTTTNISMATNSGGATTFTSIQLNSSGFPEHAGSIVIPHIDQNFKLNLFADQDAADADTPAIWSIDNIIPISGAGDITLSNALASSVSDVLTLTHNTTGTPASGIGTGIAFAAEGTDDTMTGMTIDAVTTDVGSGTEDYDFVLSLTSAGAAPAERLRISSTGVATFANDLLFTVANPEILGGDVDGVLYVGPSTTNALGGNLVLYGNTHSSKAKDIEFRATAGVELHYDDSASVWDFSDNLITTTGGLAIGSELFQTEQAAAAADVAGDGQWWVKNDTPNSPMFTDDAGTDFQLATLAGTETLTNKTITGADLIAPYESALSATSSSGTLTLDLSLSSSFYVTLTENITTITFSNAPSSGERMYVDVEYTQHASSAKTVVTSGQLWDAGAPWVMTTATNSKDIITYTSRDGFATSIGLIVAQNVS